MHWKISHLDPGLREKLTRVHMERGLGRSHPHYFRSHDRPGKIAVCLGIGAAVSAGLGFALRGLIAEDRVPLLPSVAVSVLFLLAAIWTILSLVELFHIRGAAVRPFLLVTPKVLLRSDYGFASIEGYRLSEAIGFESAKTYDERNQSYRGQRYSFRFPGAAVIFTLRAPEEIAALEDVLSRARAGGGPEDPGALLLPEGAGFPKPPGLRGFTNPLGEFWLALGAFLLVIALLGMLLSRFFRVA